MLRGDADVRTGRASPAQRIDPGQIGVLVLWTKQPASLLENRSLRDAIEALRRTGALVDLQLTVTGFGSSPVEPGIPHPAEVAATLARLVEAGLVDPRLVKLRIDPLATIRFDAGPTYSNTSRAALERILDAFLELGVTRVTASMLDDVQYPAVRERMAGIGARAQSVDEVTALAVATFLSKACASRAMTFHTCVMPRFPGTTGCIEGDLYNRILDQAGAPFRVTDVAHNAMGTQRTGCRCTYSHDIASSRGIKQCTTGGFGCIYCYAQGPCVGPALRPAVDASLERALAGDDPSWTRVP
jgi:hypothetical protein